MIHVGGESLSDWFQVLWRISLRKQRSEAEDEAFSGDFLASSTHHASFTVVKLNF